MKRLYKLRRHAWVDYGEAFSQENFAQRVGVSRQTLSSWENGETEPLISQAATMAKLLGVTIDELMREDADVR